MSHDIHHTSQDTRPVPNQMSRKVPPVSREASETSQNPGNCPKIAQILQKSPKIVPIWDVIMALALEQDEEDVCLSTILHHFP